VKEGEEGVVNGREEEEEGDELVKGEEEEYEEEEAEVEEEEEERLNVLKNLTRKEELGIMLLYVL
jgi:hypothetical protein